MGKINSRTKGAVFERTVAKKFRDLGFEARRGQQFNGLEGEDVVSNLSWHLECKAVEQLNLMKAYEQSCEDAETDQIPVVIHKKNHKPIMVTMALDDFHEAAKEYLRKIGGSRFFEIPSPLHYLEKLQEGMGLD